MYDTDKLEKIIHELNDERVKAFSNLNKLYKNYIINEIENQISNTDVLLTNDYGCLYFEDEPDLLTKKEKFEDYLSDLPEALGIKWGDLEIRKNVCSSCGRKIEKEENVAYMSEDGKILLCNDALCYENLVDDFVENNEKKFNDFVKEIIGDD
jgi:uncharacterized protein with PIN domain